MTNYHLTRRELLAANAVTGGVLAGGEFLSGPDFPAQAQGMDAASPLLDVVLRVSMQGTAEEKS